jgi:hypothetical protein
MAVLRSFAELAASVGHKIEAKERKEFGATITVETKCGSKGVRIFNLLQNRESGKIYGKFGQIILTPEEIATATGIAIPSVIGCLISLIRNGFLRATADGKAVRAA